MSFSGALNNAITGLTASSRLAEVVSSNLSNALTEGYARRSVELTPAQIGGRGGGVQVTGIVRFVDPGLLADRRLAEAALSNDQRSADSLSRLETTLGGVDGSSKLIELFAGFERALITASSDPASETRLATAVTRLGDVAAGMQDATRSIQKLRQEADAAIVADIAKLNTGLANIASLNKDILRLKASGSDPSALLDMRQTAVDEVATIVPLREIQRSNGTIGLMTSTGTTLLDGRAAVFGFQGTPTITADMTRESGALSGLTLDGRMIDPDTGIGRLGGGALGANFMLRDKTLVDAQTGLDDLAVDLIARFQDPQNDPTITGGAAGILTDGNNPLNLIDRVGLAGRISLNPAIDPLRGGIPSRLRDGLYAPETGPVGDSSQINAWVKALAAPRPDALTGTTQTAPERLAAFAESISGLRLSAQAAVSFSSAKWDSLRQAELANGVDSDFELQQLIKVEKAYAANARVIETVNFMMQRLMEI